MDPVDRHEIAGSIPMERILTTSKIFAFGFGHFFNDLCASMWFTYLLVFFNKVLQVSSPNAGAILLAGQVTDALCTPIVGIESDQRRFSSFMRYGQRKSWHLIGTVAVALSFPFIFIECFGCSSSTSQLSKMVFYIPFVVVFQIGWACVQISHLALIPSLASTSSDRTALNGVRFSFTVVANLAVFGLVWLLLGLDHAHSMGVTPHDKPQFRTLALSVVGLGIISSTVFHFGCKEPLRVGTNNSDNSVQLYSTQNPRTELVWSDWFNLRQFYQIAVVYMCSRIYVNVTQCYLPFYVLESQQYAKEYIAIIPLVVYITSFGCASALSARCLSVLFNRRKLIYSIGVSFGIGACVWMWFRDLENEIFGVAILIGISSSIVLVTSLAMVADLIGPHCNCGAFVYGALSFCDKLANGIAIQIIQILEPMCTHNCGMRRSDYYRDVMVFVPGAALVISLLVIMMMGRSYFGSQWDNQNIDDNNKLLDEEEPLSVEDNNTGTVI